MGGEPTPIVKSRRIPKIPLARKKLERIAGTAARSADSPAAKSTTGEEESNKGKTEGENAGPERRRPGKPRPAVRSGLNQAPVQVEWVGEPMPIQPKTGPGQTNQRKKPEMPPAMLMRALEKAQAMQAETMRKMAQDWRPTGAGRQASGNPRKPASGKRRSPWPGQAGNRTI